MLIFFEKIKPWVVTLLVRCKVPFCSQMLEGKWGYLVSKDGQKRTRPFRVKLKKLNKLTSIKLTSINIERIYIYIYSVFVSFWIIYIYIYVYIIYYYKQCFVFLNVTVFVFLTFSLQVAKYTWRFLPRTGSKGLETKIQVPKSRFLWFGEDI